MTEPMFEITGIVVSGDRRGRTIGFPTANIVLGHDDAELPPGVYAALADGLAAAVNVGVRPTFADATPGVVMEVHMLDFTGDLYGREMHIKVLRKIRDEQRFDSPADLIAQLGRDVAAVRVIVTELTAKGPRGTG